MLLAASIIANFIFAIFIEKSSGASEKDHRGKTVFISAIIFNLLLLAVFKYSTFISQQIAFIPQLLGANKWKAHKIGIPLGISFFTFKAISYLVDVYRGDVKAQRKFVPFATYQAFFPQLLAGPIERYRHMESQLGGRSYSSAGFIKGAERFIIGLGKKTLIANQLGPVADTVFTLPSGQLSCPVAWLGIVCYTLQIYFDFSGYSDMAIGLARIFGFDTPENFNYPYISKSIREFWRRWHITLSEWFRDYLYIPLGGNRKSEHRTYFNLIIVFFFCGLWHGANWVFPLWGLWHGLFLVLERTKPFQRLTEITIVNHVYTCAVFLFGWVFFRSADVIQAFQYFSTLFGVGHRDVAALPFGAVFNSKIVLVIFAGIVGSGPLANRVASRFLFSGKEAFAGNIVRQTVAAIVLLVIFLLAVSTATLDVYTPFIYFKF